MNFEVTIGPDFEAAVIRQAAPIMEGKLNTLRATMIEEFNAPKTGHEYRRPQGGRYRASAPGEPPAVRTGNLRDSISEPDVRKSSGALVGQITIAAPYAGYLERGTGRIAPRPFVRPAIDALLKGLSRIGGR
jgi:HK97 gp10 family phage protein